jgi:FAD/FMN-containing dehydrogenase
MELKALTSRFWGRLVDSEDPGYDEARAIWNGMIDRRPALIAQCSSTADVVVALNFARANDLQIAVRGGGHNVSGNATCDDGIVIDLGPMKGIDVDSDRRTANAEGGLTWGEYDQATQQKGLATPGGAISTTGIAGLTLGGGFGWLSRSYGLVCDNLLSAEVVTATGDVVTASADENPDLFWGIRGGGGNFGIVTRFEFQLYPVEELYAGLILYPRSQAAEFMQRYAELTSSAPDQFSSMAAFLHTPDAEPVVGAFVVYHGDFGEGERIADSLRSGSTPLVDDTAVKPYTVVQQAFDPGFPKGLRNYWKSSFLDGLNDDCIEVLIEHANRAPTPISIVGAEHMLGGAVARVSPEETAFGNRNPEYNFVILGIGDDPAQDAAIKQWARDFWTAIQPFSTGSVYVNYMSDDDAGRISEAYGETHYARLVELKKRYDPHNIFHRNQNIVPAP